MIQSPGKTVWQLVIKFNIYLAYDSANLFHKNLCSHNNLYTNTNSYFIKSSKTRNILDVTQPDVLHGTSIR